MKAFQRQIQCQPEKTNQIWSKPKKYQELFRKTTKFIKVVQPIPAKGLLNFYHRRKYQIPQLKEMGSLVMPKKSEQIQNISRVEEKERNLTQKKRHTHHATDLKDLLKEKKNKIQSLIIKDFKKERVRGHLLSQQTIHNQEFNKSRSGWKLKEKFNRAKQKTEKNEADQPHYKTSKKIDQNSYEYSFSAEAQGGSFLNLIKKFKFQNLKTGDETDNGLYSPAMSCKHAKQSAKRQISFTPFRKTFQNLQKAKEKSQSNLGTLMQYSKNKIAKISRKVPSLSPWDMKVESEFTSSSEIDELI